MMRSLFSGVSGLKVHQTRMDVIGNNISNVNTIGFRAGIVNFTDVFYQTTQNASGPNAATGTAGTNAMQIGLGANVAAISVNLSGTGATQRTDYGMDVMIQGDAFLIVRSNGMNYFTKAGNLGIDASGTLMCKANGATVMGWGVDENGDIRKDTVTSLRLMGGENSFSDPNATETITLKGNVDSEDSQAAVGGTGYPMAVSFYDNLGQLFTAKLTLKHDDPTKTNTYSVTLEDVQGPDGKSIFRKVNETTGKYEVDAGTTISFGGQNVTVAAVDPDSGKVTLAGTSPQLVFDANSGQFTSVGGNADGILNLTLGNAGKNQAFRATGVEIDFSTLTMYASDSICNVKPEKGDANGNGAGNPAGSLDGFSLQTDGKIYGVYSNGDKKLLGQLAFATFANPSGLEAVGNSMYASTLNSGEFDGIGVDISEVGKLAVGALEMSDVDLGTEFTTMITTQRGFQANSRVITTSDSMLEELVNLKR